MCLNLRVNPRCRATKKAIYLSGQKSLPTFLLAGHVPILRKPNAGPLLQSSPWSTPPLPQALLLLSIRLLQNR